MGPNIIIYPHETDGTCDPVSSWAPFFKCWSVGGTPALMFSFQDVCSIVIQFMRLSDLIVFQLLEQSRLVFASRSPMFPEAASANNAGNESRTP